MSVIGIDIGGSKVYAVRLEGTEVAEHRRTAVDHDASPVDAIANAVDDIADGSESAIGVGVAGLVSVPDGVLVWGPHVPGTDVPIAAELADRSGLPVVVDNDANAALVAELELGVARGYRNVVLVTLGTGIGGAFAIDGAVHRGGSFAGEWGHIKVERDGHLCDCGKRGCWETLASGPALERLAREVIRGNPNSSLARAVGDEPVTGRSVVAAADAGDETARALVTEVGRSFGQGLADLAAIFDPEMIVVGGGLGSVGESVLGPARRVLEDSLHGGSHRIAPSVQVARLGPAAGAVGAGLLAAGTVDGTP